MEACGYLAERDGIVAVAIPLKNADASQEHFTLWTLQSSLPPCAA